MLAGHDGTFEPSIVSGSNKSLVGILGSSPHNDDGLGGVDFEDSAEVGWCRERR